MNIQELSDTLDEKLAQVEQQLQALQRQQADTSDPFTSKRLQKEMTALKAMEQKLVKSRAVAWRAHELNQEVAFENQRIERQRRLGLGLMIVSAVALVALGWVAYGMYF